MILPPTIHPTLSIVKHPIRNENPAEIDPWEAREIRRGSMVIFMESQKNPNKLRISHK